LVGVKGFAYRRVKNDERDAADLADLLRMGRLPQAWIAPAAVRGAAGGGAAPLQAGRDPLRIVQVCVDAYRTPVSFSITPATRSRVHMSVGYPWARGPRNSAFSTSRSCVSDSRDGRPARPAPVNAGRPPSHHARYHRDAVCADTPNSRATSTCRAPRSNIRAACIRRCRNASKSRPPTAFAALSASPPLDPEPCHTALILIQPNENQPQRLTLSTKDL